MIHESVATYLMRLQLSKGYEIIAAFLFLGGFFSALLDIFNFTSWLF